jgi:hypothetical protein
MNFTLFARLALAGLLAVAAFGADVSGKWKATTNMGGQAREITFDFRVDGETLTGTMTGPRGAVDISDGKVKGDNLSFVVVRNFQGNEMKINYKGKLKDDEIKFNVEVAGREFETVAKRAKE